MNQLNRLKNRIHSKERELSPDDIDKIHHKFMDHYGWISVEEFRKIPLPAFWNLLDCINEQEKKEAEQYKGIPKPKR